MPGGLPGKPGWRTNWKSSGAGKTLQTVQVEELCLPEAYLELACCCSSEVNNWLSRGLSIQKAEYFRALLPSLVFMVLALPYAL